MLVLKEKLKDFVKSVYMFFYRPRMIYGYKRHDDVFLKNTRIGSTTTIGNKEKFRIEDNVYIGHYNNIDASNGVSIGEGCQITTFINILTHSSHISIRLYGSQYNVPAQMIGYIRGSVNVGPYTFIGPYSTIMPGTQIGKGSIVAAYSYVQGAFEDFSIIAGNPARVVGDTRKMDEKFLAEYPELSETYNEWANA